MSKSKKKAVTKKIVKPAKVAAKKAAVKKVAKKAVVKKAPVKKAVKKEVTKVAAKKPAAKKAVAKKAVVKKTTVKKAVSTKIAAKPNTSSNPLFNNTPLMKKVSTEPKPMIGTDDRSRYTTEELKEFETIILEKLNTARKQFQFAKEVLNRKNDEGTDNTTGNVKLLEDGADVLEKESFSAFAARQQKFILQLENAIARIKNGTYGICVVTGKLIPKERLRLVPHTQHTIEAKQQRK